MKIAFILLLAAVPLTAADVRAHVDGVGCRTRQLAVQRLWERLPGVTKVVILPREERPAPNQRYFLLQCPNATPSRQDLTGALGRRAEDYRVLEVTPLEEIEREG